MGSPQGKGSKPSHKFRKVGRNRIGRSSTNTTTYRARHGIAKDVARSVNHAAGECSHHIIGLTKNVAYQVQLKNIAAKAAAAKKAASEAVAA